MFVMQNKMLNLIFLRSQCIKIERGWLGVERSAHSFLYGNWRVYSVLITHFDVIRIETLQACVTTWADMVGCVLNHCLWSIKPHDPELCRWLNLLPWQLFQCLCEYKSHRRIQFIGYLTRDGLVFAVSLQVPLLTSNVVNRKTNLSSKDLIGIGSINISCIEEGDALVVSILDYGNSLSVSKRRAVDAGQDHTSKPELRHLHVLLVCHFPKVLIALFSLNLLVQRSHKVSPQHSPPNYLLSRTRTCLGLNRSEGSTV